MGWPWGSKPPPPPPPPPHSTETDPFRDLDPNLRAFLDEETPPTPPAPPPPPPPPPRPTVPRKAPIPTLYPDGRYAHLWSTYKPLREIELATKSNQEKVMDVIDAYKERNGKIERIALENCAMEQIAMDQCYKTGGWKSRMTMCRAEFKAVERCYTMQYRFLQALGYLTTEDDTKNEEIQMHADKLFQRMLMQERAAEAAKAAGEAAPIFPPLISSPSAQIPSSRPSPSSPPSSPPPHSDPFSMLSEPTPTTESKPPTTAPAIEDERDPLLPSVRAALTESLKKLPTAEEREVVEKAVTAQAEAGVHPTTELIRLHEARIKGRKARTARGQETWMDVIDRWFGF